VSLPIVEHIRISFWGSRVHEFARHIVATASQTAQPLWADSNPMAPGLRHSPAFVAWPCAAPGFHSSSIQALRFVSYLPTRGEHHGGTYTRILCGQWCL